MVIKEKNTFPHESPLSHGDILGGEMQGFQVQDYIGGGGFAYIYLVDDINRRTTAAMKVLKPSSDESRQRFDREMLLLGQMSSNPYTPNLIRRGVWPSPRDEDENLDCYVMDYVKGLTLKEALEEARKGNRLVQGYRFDERGRMDPLDCLNFLRMVVQCLQHLHTLEETQKGTEADFTGYVHRDLKTVNIMLPDIYPGHPAHVMVLDFGIAGIHKQGAQDVPSDQNLTMTAKSYTPKYAAPEQVLPEGYYGPYTDIYALGLIAYECLTGRHPYEGLNINDILLQTVHPRQQIKMPDDPRYAGIAPIVNKMLEKDATKRPQTAQDVYTMLVQVTATTGERPAFSPPHQPSFQDAEALPEDDDALATQKLSFEASKVAAQEFDVTQAPKAHFFDLEGDRRTLPLQAFTEEIVSSPSTLEERSDTARFFPEGAVSESSADVIPDSSMEEDQTYRAKKLNAIIHERSSLPERDEGTPEPFPFQEPFEIDPSQKMDPMDVMRAYSPEDEPVPPKKSSKVLLMVLVVMVLGLGGLLVWQMTSPSEKKTSVMDEQIASLEKPEESPKEDLPVKEEHSSEKIDLSVQSAMEKAHQVAMDGHAQALSASQKKHLPEKKVIKKVARKKKPSQKPKTTTTPEPTKTTTTLDFNNWGVN